MILIGGDNIKQQKEGIKLTNEIEYEVDNLYNNIKNIVEQSRNKVYKKINTEMINLHWNIGRIIVEKQKGNDKAKYGDY